MAFYGGSEARLEINASCGNLLPKERETNKSVTDGGYFGKGIYHSQYPR